MFTDDWLSDWWTNEIREWQFIIQHLLKWSLFCTFTFFCVRFVYQNQKYKTKKLLTLRSEMKEYSLLDTQ